MPPRVNLTSHAPRGEPCTGPPQGAALRALRGDWRMASWLLRSQRRTRSRPMRRCLTQVGVAVAAISFSLPALAQTTQCPPGAWFCADAQVVVPALAQAPQVSPRAVQPAPALEEPAEPEPAPAPVRRPRYAQ